MKLQNLFPSIMFLCSLGACLVYAFSGDWRRALYWGAAATITVAVTI